MPFGTTVHGHVPIACAPARQRPNKTPIYTSEVSDTWSFLAWLRASCPCGLMAQLKAERLMVVPSTVDGFRAAVTALLSLDGRGCELSHLHSPEGALCTAAGEKPGQGHAWERRSGGAGIPEHPCPGSQSAAFRSSRPRTYQGQPSHPISSYQWREVTRCLKCDHSPNSAVCECRWSRT